MKIDFTDVELNLLLLLTKGLTARYKDSDVSLRCPENNKIFGALADKIENAIKGRGTKE